MLPPFTCALVFVPPEIVQYVWMNERVHHAVFSCTASPQWGGDSGPPLPTTDPENPESFLRDLVHQRSRSAISDIAVSKSKSLADRSGTSAQALVCPCALCDH